MLKAESNGEQINASDTPTNAAFGFWPYLLAKRTCNCNSSCNCNCSSSSNSTTSCAKCNFFSFLLRAIVKCETSVCECLVEWLSKHRYMWIDIDIDICIYIPHIPEPPPKLRAAATFADPVKSRSPRLWCHVPRFSPALSSWLQLAKDFAFIRGYLPLFRGGVWLAA